MGGGLGQEYSATVEWATQARFHNPHSITWHARTGWLLVADRENAHVRLVRASDGADGGAWDCGLRYGNDAMGVPFGVRTWASASGKLDLLFVARMDNPQDGRNQRIAVIDLSGLSAAEGFQSM